MYGLITYLRNKLFDCGVLKTQTHSLLTIGVGNLKVGGTGKTPFVEHLLTNLSSEYNIAVVASGHGSKSKGLQIVSPDAGFICGLQRPQHRNRTHRKTLPPNRPCIARRCLSTPLCIKRHQHTAE